MRADAAIISIHIHERYANGDNDGRKLVVDSHETEFVEEGCCW